MTVVVTGGTGLLGRAVLERLAGRERLLALHRPSTVPPPLVGVEWLAQDLTAPLSDALPPRADAILHLAQSRRHRAFPEGAVDTFAVNAMATVRLLDYARRAGARAFVLASSGAVYAPGRQPLREDDPPAPPSFYGHAKLAAERAALAFGEELPVQVLRWFLVYGPGQDAAAFMPGIAARVRAGVPIDLHGPDGMRCNPLFVEDAAAAVEAAMHRSACEVTNVAGPEVVTLRQIGELVGAGLGIAPRYAEHPAGSDLVADVARMRERLGAPAVTPEEGIAWTLSASLPRPC